MTITTQHDLCKCNSCTSLHDLSSNMNLLRDMWLIWKEIKDTTYSALWSIHSLACSGSSYYPRRALRSVWIRGSFNSPLDFISHDRHSAKQGVSVPFLHLAAAFVHFVRALLSTFMRYLLTNHGGVVAQVERLESLRTFSNYAKLIH